MDAKKREVGLYEEIVKTRRLLSKRGASMVDGKVFLSEKEVKFVSGLYSRAEKHGRIIQIDSEQAGMLGRTWDSDSAKLILLEPEEVREAYTSDLLDSMRPPFPVTIFEYTGGKYSDLAGLIVCEKPRGDDGVRFSITPLIHAGPYAFPCYHVEVSSSNKLEIAALCIPPGTEEQVPNVGSTSFANLCGIMAFLDSANVDLREAPESQQYPIGHVARKNKITKHVVYIRQNSSRAAGSGSYTREYDHRFERRGGFVHHRELTSNGTPNRIFNAWKRDRPDKLIIINGELCVRIWRGPSIVGPEDKPFIPKTRRITT